MSKTLAKRWEDFRTSPAVHLAAYFAGLAAVFTALAYATPHFREMLLPAIQAGPAQFGDAFETGGTFASPDGIRETIFSAFIALLGALAVSAPVVWIYMVIMRQQGYEKAFVRMLTVLPVVVAGVVQVVRGDLALAFALAGIVAAVRFRTTVKDLQNAVFAFAAIGIGLASGTGSLLLASALSLVVSYMAYTMWRIDLGDVEPSLELAHSGVRLSEALVPGESHRSVVIGCDEVVEPVHAEDLEPLSDSIERLADYVRADALRKKKKFNTLLLAYTKEGSEEEAREALDEVFEEHANRWAYVDQIARNGDGIVALEYLIRLKKSVDVGKMVDRLSCGPENLLKAVELKPIRGLRDRLT